LYLIPDVELKWTHDSQRENPQDRDRLMKLYIQSFDKRKITYQLVRGFGDERLQNAIETINRELKI
jgi:nicotinamide riboside kinase